MRTTSNASARSTAFRLPLRRRRLSFGLALSLGALCLSPGPGSAQSADDYYHNGAQYFIFGEKEKAGTEVQSGIQRYPDDRKLNELAALLKQPEQPPQQGKGNDKQDKDKDKDKEKQEQQKQKQKQEQEQKEQKEKEQKEKQQQESQQQPQQQQQQQQGEQDKAQKKTEGEGQKPGQQAKPSEQGEEPEGAPQSARMMRMTPQQAVQLLEALKGEEKVMTFRPVLKTNRQDRVFKNW